MNKEIEIGFGPHLTLDCYECNKDKCSNVEFILDFLDTLPEKIGMTKIFPPQIIKYPGREDSFDKGGVSAFVIISESHIALHTFKEQGFITFDIFSCKPFDIDKTINIIKETFEFKKHEKNILNRGREFPKQITIVKEIINEDRSSINYKTNNNNL